MESQFEYDTAGDLISSESLQTFNVIDQFCEACGDITPHHIDDLNKSEDDEKASFEGALSQHECVYCREEEENKLSSW